jgi:WD40 repeat protein
MPQFSTASRVPLLATLCALVAAGETDGAEIVGRILLEQNRPVITNGKFAAINIGSKDGLSEGDTLTLQRGRARNVSLATAALVYLTTAIVEIPKDRPGPEIQPGDEFIANIPDPNQLQAAVQKGHSAKVKALAFSLDGNLLASGDEAGVVIVWSITDRRALYSARMGQAIAGIEFAANSTLLTATRDSENNVKVWNLRTGRIITSLSGHTERASAIAYSQAKSVVASTAWDRRTIVWDELSGKPVCDCKTRKSEFPDNDVAMSADGTKVLVPVFGFEGGVISGQKYSAISAWSSASCSEAANFRLSKFSSRTRMSSAGSLLAVGQLEGHLSLWSLQTQREIRSTSFDDSIFSVALAAKGDVVAAGGRSLTLWYPNSDKLERIARTEDPIECVRFSPTGTYLAWASPNDLAVRIYDVATHRIIGELAGRSRSLNDRLFLSRKGDSLAVVSGRGSVRLWNLDAGTMAPILELKAQRSEQISVSSAGELISVPPSSGGLLGLGARPSELQSWGLISSAREFAHWNSSPRTRIPLPPTGSPRDVLTQAVSPDGQFVAFGDLTGRVTVFDRNLRTFRSLNEWKGGALDGVGVERVSFSSDGKYLAWVDMRGDAELWSTLNLQRAKVWHQRDIQALAFSPDSSLIATGGLKDIIIQSTAAGDTRSYSLSQDFIFINDINFSSDNSQLVAAQGRTVAIWNLSTRRITHLLSLPDTSFEAVAFLKPGILMTANQDSTLTVWDSVRGDQLATLVSGKKSDWLAFTPDGFFDGTPGAWNTIPFHFRSDLTALFEPEQFFNQFYQPGLVADIIKNGESIRTILAKRRISRSTLDISKYRGSRLAVVDLRMESSKEAAVHTKTVALRLELQDKGSGVQDCRIFRNDSLVHFEHGIISLPTIRLTTQLASGSNRIKAYCFNRDGLKSKDSTISVEAGSRAIVPKAYIVAVGIDRYENEDFNLRFAVADAVDMADTLARNFKRIGNFQPVPFLITDHAATKPAILQTLAQLSGEATPRPTEALPDLRKIEKAGPDDIVVIFFAGHGMTVGDRYYLVPHDLGYKGRRLALSTGGMGILQAHSISDLELQAALEKLNASHSVLIADACESGQVLEMDDKRLGPLNSRGLAQLAYEKGMPILSASQTHTSALELGGNYNHGLLTYVLLEQGIVRRKAFPPWSADRLTERDWLDYAVDGVPSLQLKEIKRLGTRVLSVGGEPVRFDPSNPPIQRPQVYHRDDARDSLIIIAK